MIRFAPHAVDRYIERVRPGLDEQAALREMNRLRDVGEIVPDPPDWAGFSPAHETIAYLIIGDVAMPLVRSVSRIPYLATTCITRGTIPEPEREERNKRGARERWQRRTSKRHERRSTHRPPPEKESRYEYE